MTKLAEIQEAILGLPAEEQQKLWHWLDETPLDLEQDTPELEVELLKAVDGPFTRYSSEEMRAVCERVLREMRGA